MPKSWIVDFFARFTHKKKRPKTTFTCQNISVQNNYVVLQLLTVPIVRSTLKNHICQKVIKRWRKTLVHWTKNPLIHCSFEIETQVPGTSSVATKCDIEFPECNFIKLIITKVYIFLADTIEYWKTIEIIEY